MRMYVFGITLTLFPAIKFAVTVFVKKNIDAFSKDKQSRVIICAKIAVKHCRPSDAELSIGLR